MHKKISFRSIIYPILTLSILFTILQIFLILKQKEGFMFIKFSPNALSVYFSHKILIIQLLAFLGAHFLLFILSIIFLVFIAYYNSRLFKLNDTLQPYCAIACWVMTFLTCYLANQYFFPLSALSMSTDINQTIILIAFIFSATLLTIIFLLAVYGLYQSTHTSYQKLFFIVPIAYTFLLFLPLLTHSANKITPSKKPNIIIIGIDSLRPDHLHYFDSSKNLTPNIDKLLTKSTVFSNAYTPLARTFPAWNSILTGNYPKKHGARFNLTPYNQTTIPYTLASLLKDNGYTTIYATDEVRFSHIDTRYGYDQIISPKIGINDFIFGTLNDFLLSNLIVNSRLGKWLFPFNYMNRASFITYQPETFVKELSSQLNKNLRQPLFLSIHLELPHWPFVISNSNAIPLLENFKDSYLHSYYLDILKATDHQFMQIYTQLMKLKLLDNSIIMLLSDHGEGFSLEDDYLPKIENYIDGKDNIKPEQGFLLPNQHNGHGANILAPSQLKILFAWHLPGQNDTKKIDENVSLVDIMPTIVDLLHIPPQKTQGISLQPVLIGYNNTLPLRPIFVETGIIPPVLGIFNPLGKQILSKGLNQHIIDGKTGAVNLSSTILPDFIRNKQRAIILNNWLLAYYPNETSPASWVLSNISTKEWTQDFSSPLAHEANVESLKKRLFDFYADEIDKE